MREWLLTPVFLPGQSHGQRSLVSSSPWGLKELDTTEGLTLLLSYFVAYDFKKGNVVFLPGQLPVLSITYSNVCKAFLKCQAVQ